MDGMEQPALNCDGSVYQMYGGGTWKGHVLPGLVFFVWALWWTVQIYRAHLLGIADGSGYRSRAWWPGLWHIEPLLKIFGPPLGILVELRLDHSEFLKLLCDDGRFSVQNMHNYQHAGSYPAFTLSGLVDLLGTRVNLPQGTQQAFLALAFLVEAFLMTSHKKHEALDETVHTLLGLTMWSCAAFLLLELRIPGSFLASVGRCLSCLMQGMWLIEIGQMMHTTPLPWKGDGSMAGVMLAPVAFAMLTVLGAVILLVIYVIMQAWYERCSPRHSRLPLSHSLEESNFGELFRRGDDSANEESPANSTNGEEAVPGEPVPGSIAGKVLHAFQVLRPGTERRDKGGHLV